MIKIINNVIFRVVNIGIGIDTDSSVASDTQYRVSIGEVFEPKISQKGSEHGMSKLTEKDVLEIREIGRSKGLKEVSKIYKVSESLISNVLLNKIWNHV